MSVAMAVLEHELRTPMTIIKGMAQTLMAHKNDLPAEKVDDMLTSISEQSEKLAEKIENVIAAVKTEAL
jgi:K+-sensing histidine kinase KdpD